MKTLTKVKAGVSVKSNSKTVGTKKGVQVSVAKSSFNPPTNKLIKAVKEGKYYRFKTGDFGYLKHSELHKLTIMDYNRGLAEGYDEQHVANLVLTQEMGDFKVHVALHANQLGIVLDSHNRLEMAKRQGLGIVVLIPHDESLNTTDPIVLGEYSAKMNSKKAVKNWGKNAFYAKALQMTTKVKKGSYPLAEIISKEMTSIRSAIGGSKIEQSWIGGLIIKSFKLDREGKKFCDNLESFRNKEYISLYKSGWNVRKNDFIELYNIVQKNHKHIICPVKIVAEILRHSFTYINFDMADAKKRLKNFTFKRGFVGSGCVVTEIKRMLK